MCGIAGSYRWPSFNVEAAISRIRHRGPDGTGIQEHGDVVHGHARLAILDPTTASAQPFAYRDGVLSYNGELWNYVELRSRLEAVGHQFRTTGDTEVLAAALSEWGVAALDKLDGMFAFAWTSPKEQVLARDRFGKVPLYYLQSASGGVAWASERKGLGTLGGAADAVPPGYYFDLEAGSLDQWYSLERAVADADPVDHDELVDQVESRLRRGVEKRLVTADVPVCVLLSGGLDSSLTTAMAASVRPDVIAYTCFVDPASPDLAAARVVAKHAKIELREIEIAMPDDAAIAAAIRTIEVPNPTSIEIATLCLPLAARISADGFKVTIGGEAADELFGGYGTLRRHAGSDATWTRGRQSFFSKMGRADFVRGNKAFLSAGVELRFPFCERELVEPVLAMSRAACPPGKGLLKRAAEAWLPAEIIHREKLTFQGGAGVAAAMKTRLGASRVRHYNSLMRRELGKMTRG